MSELKKPIIFIGFPRSGTSIISDVIFQNSKIGYISNYQAKFPNSTKVNLVRNLFENKIWSLKGQKKQLNKVSVFNQFLFTPSENYIFWNSITGQKLGKEFLYGVNANQSKKEEIEELLKTFPSLSLCSNKSP